jgi:hypothetical protein
MFKVNNLCPFHNFLTTEIFSSQLVVSLTKLPLLVYGSMILWLSGFVLPISCSFFEGLQNNVVQMFTTMGWNIALKTQVRHSKLKVKVTLWGQRKICVWNLTFTCM